MRTSLFHSLAVTRFRHTAAYSTCSLCALKLTRSFSHTRLPTNSIRFLLLLGENVLQKWLHAAGSHKQNDLSITTAKRRRTMFAFPKYISPSNVSRVNAKNRIALARFLGSSSKTSNSNPALLNAPPVYIHPLSQIVLLYFQNECHPWICAHNFDRSLTLHRDGTFVLQSGSSDDSPRIWTYYDPMDKKHWLSYNNNENDIQHRFLLQDNLMPAWHGNRRKSLAERVQDSVVALMQSADKDLSHCPKE